MERLLACDIIPSTLLICVDLTMVATMPVSAVTDFRWHGEATDSMLSGRISSCLKWPTPTPPALKMPRH